MGVTFTNDTVCGVDAMELASQPASRPARTAAHVFGSPDEQIIEFPSTQCRTTAVAAAAAAAATATGEEQCSTWQRDAVVRLFVCLL